MRLAVTLTWESDWVKMFYLTGLKMRSSRLKRFCTSRCDRRIVLHFRQKTWANFIALLNQKNSISQNKYDYNRIRLPAKFTFLMRNL